LAEPIPTYAEFWKLYLRKHTSAANRFLHAIGLILALLALIGLLATGDPGWLIVAAVCGYLFGWVGHVVFQHNAPMILAHPIWSHIADLHMLLHMCTGTLRIELNKSMSRDGPESLGMYEGVPVEEIRRKKTRRD
jgi:hypothetical protein